MIEKILNYSKVFALVSIGLLCLVLLFESISIHQKTNEVLDSTNKLVWDSDYQINTMGGAAITTVNGINYSVNKEINVANNIIAEEVTQLNKLNQLKEDVHRILVEIGLTSIELRTTSKLEAVELPKLVVNLDNTLEHINTTVGNINSKITDKQLNEDISNIIHNVSLSSNSVPAIAKDTQTTVNTASHVTSFWSLIFPHHKKITTSKK